MRFFTPALRSVPRDSVCGWTGDAKANGGGFLLGRMNASTLTRGVSRGLAFITITANDLAQAGGDVVLLFGILVVAISLVTGGFLQVIASRL